MMSQLAGCDARALIVGIAIVWLAGCGPDAPNASVERSMVGDTTVVRTMTGSVWGDSITVFEELRVGTLEGSVESQFGRIDGFAVLPDSGFVVFDAMVPALREFDHEGSFVRTLGREGSGPGEYRDNLGVGVLRDGTILQYDVRNSRINRFAPNGDPLPAWPTEGQLYTGDAFLIDSASQIYTKILRGEPKPDVEWDITYVVRNANGAPVDTVTPPYPPGATEAIRTQYHPRPTWEVGPMGYRIFANTGTYAFTLLKSSGPVRIERGIAAPRWEPAFRDEINARFNAPRPGAPAGPKIEIPDSMLAMEAMEQMPDGRIWVTVYDRARRLDADEIRYAPDQPTVPIVSWALVRAWDIFEEDGTYLGRLRLPSGGRLIHAVGSRLWAMETGENGEQYIVRYRIGPT